MDQGSYASIRDAQDLLLADILRRYMKEVTPSKRGAKREAEGKYKGRAPTAQAKAAKVLSLHAKSLTKQEIANACSIGIASVYRILKTATQAV